VSFKALLIIWLMLCGNVAFAGERLTQAEAESRLKRLKSEIGSLKKDLESNRKAYSKQQKSLKAADLEIQASSLRLRKLDSSRQEHVQSLSHLHDERDEYLDSLDQRKQALVDQLLAAYRLGRESRLKLVLNQDSPATLSRTLAYFDYFSRSQASQIQELRQVLQTLDQMQVKINRELSALDVVQKNQQAILDEIKSQREDRLIISKELSGRIDSDEARLTELQQNRKDLEALLETLSNALADIPADLGERLGPKDLKGKLPMPVNGRVKHAYGQARSAGLSWQGWLIKASSGTEVSNVAYGRVAFSDWLRGYGLLMIIDHGEGFMSLYGNNESLLHEVGDWIEPGAVVSTVGSSPQNGDGLYFEIRRNGKAMDPAAWLKR
jgi:septal ring factor EnvC (AmiA/AmiB activator)